MKRMIIFNIFQTYFDGAANGAKTPAQGEKEKLIKYWPVIAALGAFIYKVLYYFFASNAEEFYDIPQLYFYDRVKLDFGMTVALLLIFIIIGFLPFMIKKLFESGRFAKVVRLLFALLLSVAAFCFFSMVGKFVIVEKWDLLGNDKFKILVILYTSIAFLVFLCILNVDFTNVSKNSLKDKKLLGKQIINKKRLLDIVATLYVLLLFVTLVLLIGIINEVSPLDPRNQKSYEILSEKDDEYRVVVGHYDGSAVLMKGNIKDNHLAIYKGNYRIEPLDNRNIEYRRFSSVEPIRVAEE